MFRTHQMVRISFFISVPAFFQLFRTSSSFSSQLQGHGWRPQSISRYESPLTIASLASTTESEIQLHESDDGFREMRETWPLWLQHGLRDSGAFRFIIDNLLTYISIAPSFFGEHPQMLQEYARVSGLPVWVVAAMNRSRSDELDVKSKVNFSVERYGPHPRQNVEMINDASNDDSTNLPLLIFVHGGAWGSGFPAMYRLLSVPFLERSYRVAILGYRTYPDAHIVGQVDDVAQGVQYLAEGHNGPIILMGHSSGAHISMLAMLRGKLPSIIGLICKSGVYDIEEHYDFERSRGLEQISPLSPACGSTIENWRKHSPTRILKTMDDRSIKVLPALLFLHGDADLTVPPTSSIECHEALKARTKKACDIHVLENTGHSDTFLELVLGGKTQRLVFDWLESICISPCMSFDSDRRKVSTL